MEKRAEIVALERKIDWQIAGKSGQIKALVEGAEKETLKAIRESILKGFAQVKTRYEQHEEQQK